MTSIKIYILITLIVLFIVAIAVFTTQKGKKTKKISSLVGIAFASILASLLFGQNRILGYSLLGLGILLAVIDIIQRSRAK